MDPSDFRRHGHALVDWIADYLTGSERYPVLARVTPGDVRRALPDAAPEQGESFDAVFADFERVIVPALTHWNHPGFFGYFAITASAPGVLAEFLSAALNQQAMLWRTSPAATELEEVSLAWLRRMLGLPDSFEGVIYDTASISSLHALAAAREAALPGVRDHGLAGTPRMATASASTARSTHIHRSIKPRSCSDSDITPYVTFLPTTASRCVPTHYATRLRKIRPLGSAYLPSSRRLARRRRRASIPLPRSLEICRSASTSGCTSMQRMRGSRRAS